MLPVIQDAADVIAGVAVAKFVYVETRDLLSKRRTPTIAAEAALVNAVIAMEKKDRESYDRNIRFFFRSRRLPSTSERLLREAKYTVDAAMERIVRRAGADDGDLIDAIFAPEDQTTSGEMARRLLENLPSLDQIIHAWYESLPRTLADIDANIHAPISELLGGVPIYAEPWMRDRFVNEAFRKRRLTAFEQSIKDAVGRQNVNY
jgi:hypothetical protein